MISKSYDTELEMWQPCDKVIIPSGVFTIGAIELKSGMELHLQKGAVLMGSDKQVDWDGK